jgi:glyoxylase-like metal-dependent hydrolase (beta-lactamase superfamily II)
VTWIEVGTGVYARRHTELDLTTGLVVGDGGCLVIDTRGDRAQGAELAAAVREITPHPWQVAVTHSHFDHYFGNCAFLPCEIWAHENFRVSPEQQAVWIRRYQNEPETAANIAATELVGASRTFTDRAELSVGGRMVVLHHFGPAHSFDDTIVHVPDAGVVFAGDLVESPAFIDESFGDGDVRNWPNVLDRLLELDAEVIVPGHGDPVGRAFVHNQRQTLVSTFAN